MLKRKLSSLMAILMVILCLTACEAEVDNSDNNIDTSAYKYNLANIIPSEFNDVTGINLDKGTYISVIGKAKGPEFWNEVERGVKKAASDLNKVLGYSGEDKIKVTYNAPEGSEKTGEQVNILDEELSRYPDVIVIATVDSTACPVQFDLAEDNGIPVLAMDSYNVNDGIRTLISTNNYEAGRTTAYKMATEIGEEGDILVITDSSESGSAIDRYSGIMDTIQSEHEGVNVVDVISLDKIDELREYVESVLPIGSNIVVNDMTDEDVIAYYIDNNVDIKGIIATGFGSTQMTIKAVQKGKNPDIKVMGFDGGKEQISALESGAVKGLIIQNPFGIGYASVVAAARTVAGEDIPESIDTGYIWVTQENMKDETIVPMLY